MPRRFEDMTTTEGNPTLTASGALGYGFTAIDTTAGAVVASLPPATGSNGVVTVAWVAGAHAATLAPSGTDKVSPEFAGGATMSLNFGPALRRVDVAVGVWA